MFSRLLCNKTGSLGDLAPVSPSARMPPMEVPPITSKIW